MTAARKRTRIWSALSNQRNSPAFSPCRGCSLPSLGAMQPQLPTDTGKQGTLRPEIALSKRHKMRQRSEARVGLACGQCHALFLRSVSLQVGPAQTFTTPVDFLLHQRRRAELRPCAGHGGKFLWCNRQRRRLRGQLTCPRFRVWHGPQDHAGWCFDQPVWLLRELQRRLLSFLRLSYKSRMETSAGPCFSGHFKFLGRYAP